MLITKSNPGFLTRDLLKGFVTRIFKLFQFCYAAATIDLPRGVLVHTVTMEKSMVLIEWWTKDKWHGKQQKVKGKDIDPTGTLNIGQAIHVKFGRKRHDAVAAESWKDNASKDNIAAVKYF